MDTKTQETDQSPSLKRLVRRLPRFYIHIKPVQTKHGPDRSLMPWWKLVPSVVFLGFRDGWWNYGAHYSGRRLWIYTKWGGVHFDLWMQTKPSNAGAVAPLPPQMPDSTNDAPGGCPPASC